MTFIRHTDVGCITIIGKMPIGTRKKGRDVKSRLLPVRVTTMDAELEFDIEVCL